MFLGKIPLSQYIRFSPYADREWQNSEILCFLISLPGKVKVSRLEFCLQHV